MDSGSAAAMVWTRRFEKLMLILAYLLAFVVVLGGALINKGLSLFMIAQVKMFLFMIRRIYNIFTCWYFETNQSFVFPSMIDLNTTKSYTPFLQRRPTNRWLYKRIWIETTEIQYWDFESQRDSFKRGIRNGTGMYKISPNTY